MILKLKPFIQIGTFIFHKKFLTTRVPVNFLEETRFSTSIYHLDTPLWRYNTRKYSLGELILLAKSKEYTLFYISDKFQDVWMTKFFRRSVFDRSLNIVVAEGWLLFDIGLIFVLMFIQLIQNENKKCILFILLSYWWSIHISSCSNAIWRHFETGDETSWIRSSCRPTRM